MVLIRLLVERSPGPPGPPGGGSPPRPGRSIALPVPTPAAASRRAMVALV
ncbi:hypothetical protein [Parafrankia colletiae]|nr:hypothetical protein [Parafrankia colletiae]